MRIDLSTDPLVPCLSSISNAADAADVPAVDLESHVAEAVTHVAVLVAEDGRVERRLQVLSSTIAQNKRGRGESCVFAYKHRCSCSVYSQ
jgi:hypothetical protein